MKSQLRTIFAIVLSVGVLFGWQFFFAKPPSPSEESVAALKTAASQALPSPQALAVPPTVAPVAKRPAGKEIVLENSKVQISLDTMGGVVKKWTLKEFTKNGKESKELVALADSEASATDWQLRQANFAAPFPIPFDVEGSSNSHVDFKWSDKGITLIKRLRLEPNSYLVRMELEVQNSRKETLEFIPALEWSKRPVLESPEQGVLFFKTPPDVWHPIYYQDASLEITDVAKIPQTTLLSGKIGWVGAESHYFLGALVPLGKEGEALEKGKSALPDGGEFFYTRVLLPIVRVLPGEQWIQKFNLFGGPKIFKSLQEVGPGLDKAIGYGWISIAAIPILYLLQFFYGLVHNYGIAIILMTVLVKLILNPINRKSIQSMKAMQQLQPKIEEIKKKCGQDKQQVNLQMMQLFKTHKINPMGGCLPMLLQIPIYIALYKVLWGSVELYHTPFFWFYKDLSAPDPYLIMPIILGIAMVFQTKMTPSPSADPMQKKIMMIMPVMFSGIMIFLPMGLTLYILVNTVMTILQQWMFNKGIRLRDLLRGKIQSGAI